MKNAILPLLILMSVMPSALIASDASSARTITLPGLRPDGSVLLPNQWSLRPAGRQVTLGDFPVNIAVHPDGHFAAVLHCGYSKHEIILVDIDKGMVVGTTPVKEAFYGLEFSKSGSRLYCSGSADEVIHVFDFKSGVLTSNEDIRVSPENERSIPCGIAVSGNSSELFVANVFGQYISKLNPLTRKNVQDFSPFEGLTNIVRQSGFASESDDDEDQAAISKRMRAALDPVSPSAPFPYACRIDDRHHLLYTSLWGRAAVSVLDLNTGDVIATLPTDEHPNEMALTRSGFHLFVANANRNTVTVIDIAKGKTIETLFASFSHKDPPGSAPNSLALSPDEKTLYVANACNNNIAVFDVSVIGKSRSLGFIPVGWYPTSVRVTPDGRHLLVANGKGIISKANPNGPAPGKKKSADTQYIGSLFPGALSIIDLPRGRDFQKQLSEWTTQAYLCVPQKSVPSVEPGDGNPVPSVVGRTSPIKHCIYIIKENRTYDQVFGDMKEGNGDERLCLFPEKVTPNHHKLAREFALLDNFYVDAEVSADGHEWSMGAFATDFVEKTWPMDYGHGKSKKFPYPSEGHFPIARPANGYLWDRASEAGITYMSLGEFVSNSKDTNSPCFTRLQSLQGHFDPYYRSFDTSYRDVLRAERFIFDLKNFEAQNDMPRLLIARLPNDHTSGGSAGKASPIAQVADNDLALGMVVEAVSHSKFWPETAIFVLEDDAQNGSDHVDAHRSPALVISPYTRRHFVDSTMYSTSSMLRTMELILGLQPMSQYDASATPMFNVFQSTADTSPFQAAPALVDLDEKNPKVGLNADLSRTMNLSKEDAVDDRLMNEVIWRSVRGEKNPMPAPTRAAFVRVNPKADSDD